VKTKRLTPWCSLYYSELKYNIKVSPSVHRAILLLLFYLAFAYFTLAVLVGFKLWLGLFILALFGCVVFFYCQAPAPLATKWLLLFNSIDAKTSAFFVLSATGICQFNHRATLQISANSQINLWGYWLVFTTGDAALTKLFIFKDSLSSEDQARLARTIMRMQKSPELPQTD